MGFESTLKYLAENGGPAGIVVSGVILSIGLWLRAKGFVGLGDGQKLVDSRLIADVAKGVEAISADIKLLDKRVATVENDVESRATRKEVHDLQLSIARMEGRFDVLETSMKSTGASVTRMEDFLIRISDRERGK